MKNSAGKYWQIIALIIPAAIVMVFAGCTTLTTETSTATNTTGQITTGSNPFGNQALMETFVTPNDQTVKNTLANILNQKSAGIDNYKAIVEWVKTNLKHDPTRMNSDPHTIVWQTPSETLQSTVGVCIDYSTTLCSLLRAAGAGADQVYIGVSVDETGPLHAYLVEKVTTGSWQILDAYNDLNSPVDQASLAFLNALNANAFNTYCCFNDVAYIQGLPLGSQPTTQVNPQEATSTQPQGTTTTPASVPPTSAVIPLSSSPTTTSVQTTTKPPISSPISTTAITQPSTTPPSTTNAPNIKIQTLTLPPNARAGSGLTYPTTFRLTNAESVDITVNWQASSSITGIYDFGSVTIPKNGYLDVTKNYTYNNVGPATIIYTIFLNGVQLDQKSGTMTVTSFNPNIKIQSVTLPSSVKANPNVSYPTTFRLTNGELVDVAVTWKAHSSITGDYDSGTVTVPKNGFLDVTRSYIYNSAGTANLTYTVSYNGTQVGTWSGSLTVAAFPNVTIQSVTLPPNVKANSGLSYPTTIRLMNNESTDVMVTWKANSSVTGNFDSGTVTIPKNSYVDVARSYFYSTPGPVNLTYTIYYSGNLVDTKSASLNVTALSSVRIQSVTLPANARMGFISYSTIFRLVNSESVDMIVTWKANSSVTGNFDNGTITIPKNGYIDVTRGYTYSKAGPVTITYTVYFNGNLLDTWSGVMTVLP